MTFTTAHDIRDGAKLNKLMASMREQGWQGQDLVADGDQLLTGTHRFFAWTMIGNDADEIPVIDIRDLNVYLGGFTWDEVLEDAGGDTEFALTRFPQSVQQRYGFDTDTVPTDTEWSDDLGAWD